MATTAEQTSTGGAPGSVEAACEDCHVEEVLDQLDRELVGLKPVKTRIREIAALLMVDKLRKGMGLTAGAPSLHMSFTGNPGTGKTTVALRMAEILHRLGYIRRPEVTSVTRDDLVGQYIGHTAPKTKEVLKKAMGGVLFIDEAYYLYKPENERDYGQESIEILLQVMENQRDDLVVILAGYKDRMDTFFSSNPGFASRVAHHLDFPDFAEDELMQITQLMLQQQQYRLSSQAELVFYDYLQRRMKMPQFANARSIRNALDRGRLRQANRLYAKGGTLTREQLMTIEAEDIMVSRVFQEGKPNGLKEVAPGILPPATLSPPWLADAAAEKKTLANAPRFDQPVAATPHARREATREPPNVIQDSPMQTNMTPDESAQHNSPSVDAGFGGMPRPLPPAQPASRWQKRTQRTPAAQRVQPSAPPLREAPKVVNGQCEFGQCEHETPQESVEPRVPPTTHMKPAPLPIPLPAQTSGSSTDVASGFGVPRELHPPRVVVVRRTSNTARKKAARDRTPTPLPQINRPQSVVVNGRCEFGQCEVPPKVEEASTTGGQIVTGTLVERSAKVTGNEPGSCKKITGTEYIGPDQYTALCASAPYVPPAKVGVTHTVGGTQRVTGTEVGPSTKVTGDERGAGKRVTGNEYLNAEQFELLTASKPIASQFNPSPAKVPAKIGVSSTQAGQRVSGTEVGRSTKVTGDEPGACLKLTGSQYVPPDASGAVCQGSGVPHKVSVMSTVRERLVTGTDVAASASVTGSEYGACSTVTGIEYAGLEQYQACSREPVLTPEKVSLSRTWREQTISGSAVEHNAKVTGDEYGGCQPISGTEYIGSGQYSTFCPPDSVSVAQARVATPRGAAGESTTGVGLNSGNKVTGSARSSALRLSGTPYSDDARYAVSGRTVSGTVGMSQHPLTRGPVDRSKVALASAAAPVQSNFSIMPPARAAQASPLNRITGTAYGAQGRITGPVNLAIGLVSGTPEFRYREESVPAASAQTIAPAATQPTNRVTGEGREAGFAITGAAWRRDGSTTGTEGVSAARRNPTLRGDQRSMAMQIVATKREHTQVPPSKVTGSSGNTATGSTITYSGGARG